MRIRHQTSQVDKWSAVMSERGRPVGRDQMPDPTQDDHEGESNGARTPEDLHVESRRSCETRSKPDRRGPAGAEIESATHGLPTKSPKQDLPEPASAGKVKASVRSKTHTERHNCRQFLEAASQMPMRITKKLQCSLFQMRRREYPKYPTYSNLRHELGPTAPLTNQQHS